nr:autotransporter outer membrane beta-barrel domain-containing protein [uncultured Bdellovibrio sp.]
MKSSLSFFIVVGLLTVSFQTHAQTSLEGFSSGRYEVRKSAKKVRRPASEGEATPMVTDGDGVKVRTLKASELEAEEKARKEAELAKIEAEKKEAEKKALEAKAAQEAAKAKTETSSPGATAASDVQEPGISEQAESLFSSKAEKIYDFYRETIHPDDIRNNRVELDVMPVVAYNDSQSNYSYRDYQSFFNALKFKTNVWLTPLIGVSGQIMFSFAADVDAVSGSSRVPAKYEFVDLGVNFRKFFGVSRKSSSVEFSILLSDNKMNVPSDNTSRARLKSQGFGVGLKARIPSSQNYSWVIGGSFFPRLQHTETETGAAINSGSSEESIRIGLDLGGEWKFTRESQMIWNLGLSAERNVFDGNANLPDPSTGTTPSNVSVTNSLYMFSLGYRWGH